MGRAIKYAGEGLILLFSVLLMGFVKTAFCRLTCLIYMSTSSVWLLMLDDLVILAPYVAGLSKLLSICEIFDESNDIIFNQKKSASLCFISKMVK